MDSNELNGYFDQVEKAYRGLISEYNLDSEPIERWQWGDPNICLVWHTPEAINKNINVYVEENQLIFEANSWKDMAQEDTTIRYWENFNNVSSVNLDGADMDEIGQSVEEAYQQVAPVTDIDDLAQEEDLSLQRNMRELLDG